MRAFLGFDYCPLVLSGHRRPPGDGYHGGTSADGNIGGYLRRDDEDYSKSAAVIAAAGIIATATGREETLGNAVDPRGPA